LGNAFPKPQAPKYIISTPKIEEQKQYMRDYALLGKFLGLWSSERELVKGYNNGGSPKDITISSWDPKDSSL
jgi:hypothetical protein